MDNFFNFTLWDFLNRPEIKILKGGAKLAAKGIASAESKREAATKGTAEFEQMAAAALNGNAEAQFDLSSYYVEKQDYEHAFYWLGKSAEQGNEHALAVLEMFQGG